jgi:hypothetical protein
MVFELDPDRPNIPGIARILWALGMLSLVLCIGLILLAFSRLMWVNQTMAWAGGIGAFMFALILLGQAKTLELLAMVSARVKSRFAMEGLLAHQQAAPVPEKKPAPAAAQQPAARVITIPEQVAREQGVSRTPQPRDFG